MNTSLRRVLSPIPTVLLVVCAGVPRAHAEVTRIDVFDRQTLPLREGGASDAKPIVYERITGRYHGELDPDHAANRIITDLNLAPRNARGRVSYSATFELARPVDAAQASGVLFYDVPNRGNGRAVQDPYGHMHLISGWQGDLPQNTGLQTASVPLPLNLDGSPVTGRIAVRFVDMPDGSNGLPIIAGQGAGVPRPLPVTLDTKEVELWRYNTTGRRVGRVSAQDFAFADCREQAFPGSPDPARLCVRGGFNPLFAYELTYLAKDPPILGVGFAAVRDLVSYMRHGSTDLSAGTELQGRTRHTVATGVSQSGNYLRSFVHLGFNADEQGRRVFDGLHPMIAARQVPLNLRFGVPGGAAGVHEPGSEGVLWWGSYRDRKRGLKAASLLDRCNANQTCPKIIDSSGSAEFWNLRLSPNYVGFEGKDISLPSNVRRYYFPGVTHGGGAGGFPILSRDAPPAASCTLPANPNPTAEILRALNVALVQWVTQSIEPPPSRYPTLAKNELVRVDQRAMSFPKIPGVPNPAGALNPFTLHDFGDGFHEEDVSGVMQSAPPRVLGEAAQWVPKVDADGNEIGGIPSVQHRVPLGTYLGWNVTAAGYNAGKGCGLNGGFVPFARTRAERLATNDPRPSLQERYGSKDEFLKRVREAVAQLQSERLLLPADAQKIIEQAQTVDL